MGSGKKGKGSKQASPKVQAQPQGGGSTGRAAVASDSDGTLASFFKQFFKTFVFVFIVLMIAVVWFLYRPWLEIVVIAVVLLVLVLGGLFWFLKKRTDEPDARLLNETHDLHDYPKKPQEELGSLITQTPPLQTSASSEKAPSSEFENVKVAFRSLAKRVDEIDTFVKGIDARLTELERELFHPTNPKSRDERRPAVVAPASPPPRRPAQDYNTYRESQSRPSSIDLSSLSQTVCRFLADQTGGWEIERLVQSVQGSMDGNASIDVEHLVPHSFGEWRLVALWPQSSPEGLVLVSSGELVDDDIAKYFDVGYGRRIIACKQPARVSRSGGSEITVLSRGKVESS